jgi:hypothetical protein
MCQGLTPGVQNGDHSGLGTEMLEISTDDADRFCRRLEQNVVHDGLVLQGQPRSTIDVSNSSDMIIVGIGFPMCGSSHDSVESENASIQKAAKKAI